MRKNKKSATRLRKAEKVIRITLISLVSLVVVVVGVAGLYVNNLLNKVDYDHDDPTQELVSYETDPNGNIIMPDENGTTTGSSEDLSGELGEPTPTVEPEDTAPPINDEEVAKAAEEAQNAISDGAPIMSSSNVINILLIGVDARTAGQVTNSDTMILISINKTKKQITMSSLMRDMYVAIPGVGNTKLNHANAIGGPSLLLKTVQENFKVQVNEYVMVDFYSMANIVDILGGVTVNVTAEELPYVNNSVRETNRQQGNPTDQGLLQSSGTVTLTGAQAVGYARIRKIGNADFGRTQRQRTIMTAIFNNVKGSSIGTLNNLANSILPQVKTNISKNTLLGYMALIPSAANYPITQLQIPANGSYTSAMIGGLSYLVPNIASNRSLLHSTIY